MRDKIRKAFNMQRYHARCRGIEFLFTFEEWVNWWEDQLGPDWMQRRGCRRPGQYVMARYEDKGPYASWNVECITNEENSRRAKHKPACGECHGKSRLTPQQVLEIYKMTHSGHSHAKLGRDFNISASTILYIKRGETWSHVTKHSKWQAPSKMPAK